MGQELTWPIFFGGLAGLAFLSRRRAIFLYSTLVIYFIFCWLYRFGNWFQVIIPAYPIFIIGVAAGLARGREDARTQESNSDFSSPHRLTSHRVTPHASSPHRLIASRFTPHALYLLLTVLLLYRFSTNLPRANQSNRPGDTGLDPGWAILADRPTPPALISGDFPEQVALQYLHTVWGVSPGIYPTEPGDFTSSIGAGQADTRSVSYYMTRRAAAVAPATVEMYPQAAGEQLIALRPTPRTELPATVSALDLPFGEALKLAGWERVDTAYPLPGDVASRLSPANWQIALYWQTSQPLKENYTVSVRPLVGGQLITVNGEALIQDHQPVWDVYPTSRWRPGEIVRDVYALSLPVGLKPEAIQVLVYKTTDTGFENLAEQIIVDRR
jgi:hypothetical protein